MTPTSPTVPPMTDPATFVIRHPASGQRYRETPEGWLILAPLTYTSYPSEAAAEAARDRMLALVRPAARGSWVTALVVTDGDEAAP